MPRYLPLSSAMSHDHRRGHLHPAPYGSQDNESISSKSKRQSSPTRSPTRRPKNIHPLLDRRRRALRLRTLSRTNPLTTNPRKMPPPRPPLPPLKKQTSTSRPGSPRFRPSPLLRLHPRRNILSPPPIPQYPIPHTHPQRHALSKHTAQYGRSMA